MKKVGKYYDVNHSDGIEVEITFGKDQRIIINNETLAINNTFFDLKERYVDENGATVFAFENEAKVHIEDYRHEGCVSNKQMIFFGSVVVLIILFSFTQIW